MALGSASPPASQAKIVGPAVAGLFYPAEAGKLSADLDVLLAKAPELSIKNLRALICPHAGYP
jgi:AmmeMemoRadiSam system protein B